MQSQVCGTKTTAVKASEMFEQKMGLERGLVMHKSVSRMVNADNRFEHELGLLQRWKVSVVLNAFQPYNC